MYSAIHLPAEGKGGESYFVQYSKYIFPHILLNELVLFMLIHDSCTQNWQVAQDLIFFHMTETLNSADNRN